MADERIGNSQEWFDLPDANKKALVDQSFAEDYKGNKDYESADEPTKAKYRFAYERAVQDKEYSSEHNPDVKAAKMSEWSVGRSGAIGNAMNKVAQSHEDLTRRAAITDDVTPDGQFDKDFYRDSSKIISKRRQNVMTGAQKELASDIATFTKSWEKDGTLSKAAALAILGFDIATNPEAVLDTGAESSSSITAMGMGAWAGGKVGAGVGSVVPGVGTAVGATIGTATGVFTAGATDAGSHKLLSQMEEKLQEEGLEPTEANLKMLFSDPEVIKEMQTKAAKYGGVLGLVDMLTGGIASKIATLPTKLARSKAIRSIGAGERATLEAFAKSKKLNVDDYIEDAINNRARNSLTNRSFKSKLGSKSISLGGEVLSEPLSEAVATASVGDEIKAEDLIYETIGGIGAGPFGAAVNTAAFGTKIGKDKTKEFTRKILASTPEHKQAIKDQKDKTKVAKKQTQSRSEVDHNKKVQDTAVDDAVVDNYSDPKHEQYDPVLAVDIIAKADATDTASLDKAKNVLNNLIDDVQSDGDRLEKIAIKIDASTDKNEVSRLTEEYNTLDKTIDRKIEVHRLVKGKVDTLTDKHNASTDGATAGTKNIDVGGATTKELEGHLDNSFGSHSSKEQIKALESRTDLSPEHKEMLGIMSETIDIRESIESSPAKTIGGVREDVYRGSARSKYRGIDSYQQGIKAALANGNVEEARSELNGLKAFRDAHAIKSKNVTSIQQHFENNPNKPLPPELQKIYTQMQLANKKLDIHKGSAPLVNAIAEEATALEKEVEFAESRFKVYESKSKPSAQAKPEKAPESKPQPVEKEVKAPAPEKSESTPEPVVKEEPVVEKPATDTKESTPVEEVATVDEDTDPLAEYDDIDLDNIDIEIGKDPDGKVLTKPHKEVIAKIDNEIEEYTKILKCCE